MDFCLCFKLNKGSIILSVSLIGEQVICTCQDDVDNHCTRSNSWEREKWQWSLTHSSIIISCHSLNIDHKLEKKNLHPTLPLRCLSSSCCVNKPWTLISRISQNAFLFQTTLRPTCLNLWHVDAATCVNKTIVKAITGLQQVVEVWWLEQQLWHNDVIIIWGKIR